MIRHTNKFEQMNEELIDLTHQTLKFFSTEKSNRKNIYVSLMVLQRSMQNFSKRWHIRVKNDPLNDIVTEIV